MLRLPATVTRLLLLATMGLTFGPRAEAQLFVNPALGADSNSGTKPAQAFQHIGKALLVAGSSLDVIHLAPGTYGAVSGEVFPLQLGAARLVGDGGSAATHIVGSANDILFNAASLGVPGGTILILEGLSLEGGHMGLLVNSPAHVYNVTLRDVAISGMSQDGIACRAIPSGATPCQVNLFATQVSISGCLRGLDFLATSPVLTSILSLVLCNFTDNTVGVNVEAGGDVIANVTLSRFLDQELIGFRSLATGGTARIDLSSSLVARNAVGVEVGSFTTGSDLTISACTIVDNPVTGLNTATFPVALENTVIVSSILWGNGDDVALGGPVSAEFTDVADGDFGTINGNLSVDPLFRDAPAGDYRLSWGSPVIEAGGPAPAFDLLGNLRPVDGNLDAVATLDMGALEFMALELISPVQDGDLATLPLGGTLRLEAWGAPGATALLFVAAQQLVTPFASGFGFFFLHPAPIPLGSLAADPTTPGVLQAVLPTDPAFIGLPISFQALTTSAIAPKGAAFTDAVQFIITP